MDPAIAGAAGNGLNHLFDYGPTITVLVLVLVAFGFAAYKLVSYLLTRCDARFQESLDMHKELANDMKDVIKQNATAITQLSDSIRNMKG